MAARNLRYATRFVVLLSFAALMIEGVGAQARGPVSESLRARSIAGQAAIVVREGNPFQLVQVLAGQRVAVGAVLTDDDRYGVRVDIRERTAADTTLGAVLDLVRDRSWPLDVGEDNQVLLVLSRTASRCAPLLERKLDDVQLSGQAHDVITWLARMSNGEAGPFSAGGLVGSGPPEAFNEADLFRREVTINRSWGGLLDSLNEISRQIPGLGWTIVQTSPIESGPDHRVAVTRDPTRAKCLVGLVTASGRTSGQELVVR